MMSAGKRKREDFSSQYKTGGYIPQQDGAGDAISGVFQVDLPSSQMLFNAPLSCSSLYFYYFSYFAACISIYFLSLFILVSIRIRIHTVWMFFTCIIFVMRVDRN